MLSEKLFILSCQNISALNRTNIAQVFGETMQTLWPDVVKFGEVLFFVTDATSYMKLTSEGLSVKYHKLINVAYVVQGWRIICEICPNVGKLVANGEKTFVKSSAIIELFKIKTKLHTHHSPQF
jgi:hypothetical protein